MDIGNQGGHWWESLSRVVVIVERDSHGGGHCGELTWRVEVFVNSGNQN